MAIKFEDKSEGRRSNAGTSPKAQIEARFATPIEATDPVNTDASSELPFGKLPKTEKKARAKLRKGS